MNTEIILILLALICIVLLIVLVVMLNNVRKITGNTDSASVFSAVQELVHAHDSESRLSAVRADSFERANERTHDALVALRDQTNQQLTNNRDTVEAKLSEIRTVVDDKLNKQLQTQQESLSSQQNALLAQLGESNKRLAEIRSTLETQLKSLQEDNSVQLERMRATVDEKLQKTLNERITQSFSLVNESLDKVGRGLGEMQTLAQDVGGLKKVLSNVKSRGIVGEIQLGAILKEILSPTQYEENVATVPGSANRVEFAVKMPGETGEIVYLPIDSKFPGDAYEHLRDAIDEGDAAMVDSAWKALESRLKQEAKDVHEKYVEPPATTGFGIIFLPFEGLYAEVVNHPGLIEEIQREYRVNIAGPSTMAALLNSLQMGFQTVAIQKRAGEIQDVLAAVKTEFGKYHEMLLKAQKQLGTASKTVDLLVGRRSRAMERKLRSITELDDPVEAERILGIGSGLPEDVDEELNDDDDTEA